MPIVSEQQLKANIKAGNILNTYFIFGDDTYLKKNYVDKIIDKTVDRNDDFNFLRFEGECNLQEVYDAKEQFPMMSDKKCVVLIDYDFEGADKSDYEKLVLLLSEPNETTVFIYWCNNFSFDEKRSEKFKGLVSATEKGGGMAVSIGHRTAADLVKVLSDGAKKRGTEFANGAASYLIESCSEDINILLSELEKLCSYSKCKPITREMIDKVCVKTVEASVYSLSNEIISLNPNAALKILDDLYALRVEPLAVLHTISSTFIDIKRAMAAKTAGLRIDDLAERFDYKNKKFALEKAARQTGKFDNKKIEYCLSELIEADKLLKSFSNNDRIVLETLILRLIYIISKGEKID